MDMKKAYDEEKDCIGYVIMLEKTRDQILFDDDANVRASWSNGMTVDANNNILEFLSQLIYEIYEI